MCGPCRRARGFGPVSAFFVILGFGSRIGNWFSSETFEAMQSSVFFAAKPLPSPVPVKSVYSPPTTVNDPNSMAASGPKWRQKIVSFPPLKRGCHLVTHEIVKEIRDDLSGFKCGLAHLFLQHTSASLTINENYDSDVREDTETFLNKIVPEGNSAPWRHTIEETMILWVGFVSKLHKVYFICCIIWFPLSSFWILQDLEIYANISHVFCVAQMICQHTSNHQCLVAHSRFQLQMGS